MRKRVLGLLIAGAGALGAVGCSDSAAPDALVQARVTLSAESTPTLQVVALAGDALDAAQRPIALETVDSLIVVLERVEVVPDVPEGEEGEGQWYELAVVGDGAVDLMALPSAEGEEITVAAGEVPAGDYLHARLYFASAQIWFNDTVTSPSGMATFDPDTPYDVIIPSSGQTGIKTDAGFSIPEEGGDIPLLFDPDATIQHVNVTGNGTIMVPPVIKVKGTGGA